MSGWLTGVAGDRKTVGKSKQISTAVKLHSYNEICREDENEMAYFVAVSLDILVVKLA